MNTIIIFVFILTLVIYQSTGSGSLSDVFEKNLAKDEVMKYIKERRRSTLVPLKALKPSVKNQYLVKFKNFDLMEKVLEKIKTGQIPFDPTFLILHTFPQIAVINVRMSSLTLSVFRNLDEVALIETDGIMKIAQTCPTQSNAQFCLSRSSDYTGSSSSYKYPSIAGNNVTVYVIDTGVNVSHPDLGGRATAGMNFVSEENNVDMNGHGTICASLVMGNTCGTAKQAKVVSVKVLNKDGSGNNGAIIAAMYWAAVRNPNGIISMSLGGPKSDIVNIAVDNVYQYYGSFIAVAAGNENQDSKNVSPASATNAFTVAASDSNNNKASFSNYGTAVKLFSPGVNCYSANYKGGYVYVSGTSMATPILAGWAAILKSSNSSYTAATIRDKLIQYSVNGVIKNVPSGTTTRIINVRCPIPT